jgi:hypothetical protein
MLLQQLLRESEQYWGGCGGWWSQLLILVGCGRKEGWRVGEVLMAAAPAPRCASALAVRFASSDHEIIVGTSKLLSAIIGRQTSQQNRCRTAVASMDVELRE